MLEETFRRPLGRGSVHLNNLWSTVCHSKNFDRLNKVEKIVVKRMLSHTLKSMVTLRKGLQTAMYLQKVI